LDPCNVFKPSIVALDIQYKMSSNILFLVGNNVLTCQNLGQDLLELDGGQKVFNEAFHFHFQDEGSWGEELPKHSQDHESPIHKRSKIDLDCE